MQENNNLRAALSTSNVIEVLFLLFLLISAKASDEMKVFKLWFHGHGD